MIGKTNISRARSTGGKTPVMTPVRIFLPNPSPSRNRSHASQLYVFATVLILDKAPINATAIVSDTGLTYR